MITVEAKKYFKLENDIDFIPVSSVEAALVILLSFFRQTKKLENKNSEVLVSSNLRPSYYNAIIKRAFPTNIVTPGTKGVIATWELGFPQKMREIYEISTKRDWFVIEDWSERLPSNQTFDACSFLSDAYILRMPAGAAILTPHADLARSINRILKVSENFFLPMMSYWTQRFSMKKQNRAKSLNRVCSAFEVMLANVSDQALTFHGKKFKDFMLDQVDADSSKNLAAYYLYSSLFPPKQFINLSKFEPFVPYKFPLIIEEPKIDLTLRRLSDAGYSSRLSLFDLNNNIVTPFHSRVIELPLNVDDADLHRIYGITQKALHEHEEK